MSEILVSNVTFTITEHSFNRRKKTSRGTIAFGNGVLTMPTAGIPMGPLSNFGFIRQLDSLDVYPQEGTSNIPYKYQSTSNCLVPTVDSIDDLAYSAAAKLITDVTLTDIPQQGVASASSTAIQDDSPDRTTLDFVAVGW